MEAEVAAAATGGNDGQKAKYGGGCDLFWRQFCALVRKNFLTKRRAPITLLFELGLPTLFIYMLSDAKRDFEISYFPSGLPVDDTPVPTYGTLQAHAVYPQVLCYDDNLFMRCGCPGDDYSYDDDWTTPSWDVGPYITGEPINYTGSAMWSTGHSAVHVYDVCSSANTIAGSPDNASIAERCTTAKFFSVICPHSGDEFDVVGSLDDICGAGTSSSLDLSAEEYVDIITDTLATFESVGVAGDIIVPDEEIENVCQSLKLAVMPADDSSGTVETADFLSFVAAEYPDTGDRWESFDSEKDFVDFIRDENYSQAIGEDYATPAYSAAIVFSSGGPDWEYTIRANMSKANSWTTSLPSTKSSTDNNCRDPVNCTPWISRYHQSGVLSLQQLVDNWIINQTVASGNTAIPKPAVRLSEFPNAEYQTSAFWEEVDFLFGLLIVISVMYPVANVIHALVKEKELRIKEGLKMMGLRSSAHTVSWTFHFGCLFLAISVLLMLMSGELFENSDLALIFLYFLFFFAATTAFCFFVSAFFSRAKTAATLGSLAYFLALFPYFGVRGGGTSGSSLRAACMLPPTCLAIGTLVFREYEDIGEGVTRETMFSSDNDFTFNDVLVMFVVDTIVFACLAWYAANVLPSEWGTSQKPWFIFTKTYWRPALASRGTMKDSRQVLAVDESENRESVEPVSEQLRAQVPAGECVAIRGLTKVYKNSTGGKKVAVDKLDLTMYSGQITALLGHNGAGKTTTIAMLTGMTPVTSGYAFVTGRNAKGDMSNIRRSLGVCPQHDILYPDLTVREHLRMYAVLKGVPRRGLREVIKKTLLDVGLTEKENERTKALSGGQKRKLSVGIALIGDSRVVFLDEPTSGMDPHSRRFTWELIRKNREGRVIVLTTHFMDEADLLGDRVAIMADGALKCCGSSLFLKNHYGVGYNLTIVRAIGRAPPTPAVRVGASGTAAGGDARATIVVAADADEEDEEVGERLVSADGGDAVTAIKQLVLSHVSSATILSNVGAELSFQLPNDASSAFRGMLSEIDSRMEALGISSYGMSVTTLDEVFLRVAEGTMDFAGQKHLLDANGNGNGNVNGNGNGVGHAATPASRKQRNEGRPSAVTAAQQHSKVLARESEGPTTEHGNKRASPVAPSTLGLQNSKNRNKAVPTTTTTTTKGNVSGPSLFAVHMAGLLQKRYLTFRREKKMWCFGVAMPAIFVFMGVMIVRLGSSSDQPDLLLTPEHYNNGGAPFAYAQQCTNTATTGGTCDPAQLMAYLTDPDSATPFSLDIDESSVSPEEGTGLMNAALLEAPYSYNERIYGALSFREADTAAGIFDYTIHSNYSALHAAPTYLNQVNNAILRLASGEGDASITTTMHPMPRTDRERDDEEITNYLEGFLVSLFIMIAFTFVPSGWISFIVREREIKCKHQQVVSGVGLNAYWLSSLLWDFVSALLPAGFTIIILFLADVSSLIEKEALGALVTLFVFYSLSMPSYTYLWSFLFKSHSMAQNVFLALNFVLGLLAPLIIVILSTVNGPLGRTFKGLGWLFRFCPQFALAEGLWYVGISSIGDLLDRDWSPFDIEHTGKGITYMACSAVGYFVIVLGVERITAGSSALSGVCGQANVAARGARSLTPAQWGDEDIIDEDVAAEVLRVSSGAADADVVKIDGLAKVYPSSHGVKVAVKSTFLGIPRGECFGLLGVNGAGKSSILSILSGEIPPTRGEAFLGGYNVRRDPEAIHRLVGYCPQFDALFETLTGREHLKLYGAIKGIRSTELGAAVEKKIDEMGLRQYADRLAGGYSGGNKRKLSVAIAMIGDPQIVFLDEPSTGMDPMARRMMWNYVKRTVTENKECAMILTTHSMDECEALCQRIGIMVGGRMRCLGSSQHLKTRFGKGFMLEARIEAIPAHATEAMMSSIAPATNGESDLPVTSLGPALDAVHMPELAPQIAVNGFGAGIYNTLLHHGTVSAREFSTWLCLEQKCSRMIQFMMNNFHGVVIREKQNAKMRFEFPQQETMTLADIFGVIEEHVAGLCVSEYALSQTSLEQIFNGFAAQQEEETHRAAGVM